MILRFHRIAAVVLALVPFAGAQSIDDLRDALRMSLSDVKFAKDTVGLIALSDELELNSARFKVDGDFNTEFSTIALPYQRTFRTSDSPRVGLHVEGVFGYGRLTESTDDLYAGIDPDLRTAVDSKVTTYGFLAGVGPEFVVVDTFTITPIANFGLSRLESDADYTGPGAEFTAALADGIAFNWDAWAWSAGGAVRLDWSRPLSKTVNVELVGRYDFRWTGVFAADDDVQEFTSTIQMLTLRAQFTGPTGLAALGGDLYWRGILGYRRVLDGDLFDVTDFFQIGGALELDVKGRLPVGSRISLGGAIFLGESITGWSVGVGFSF